MFVEEKAVGEEQPVKLGTLKLSEAIRAGAKLRQQCRDNYYSRGRSCALGAAWEGAGQPKQYISGIAVVRHFGLPDDNRVLSGIIVRNDAGHTREEIADWVEAQGF